MNYFFVAAFSFIIVFLITPNIRYFALKFYAVDKKNSRKIHKKIVTKLGGLAIYLGFLGGFLSILFLHFLFVKAYYYPLAGLLISSGLIILLGIYDDFQESSVLLKLIIQIICALLIIKSGFLLRGIFINSVINIEFAKFSTLVTVLWIVGIINAINLLDGLDGLATGVIGITASFFFISGLLLNDNFVIYISLATAGACFAFLRYNFFPAKIFMGDTGSLFLGLIVACLAIHQPPSHSNNPYFAPALILLFLPILDTVFAILRRVLRKQNIFVGDVSHIHHYFIKKGFGQVKTVLMYYLTTFILGIISLSTLFFIIKF